MLTVKWSYFLGRKLHRTKPYQIVCQRDLNIPPRSSVLLPVSVNSISDAAVVFELFGRICVCQVLPLLFSIFDIISGSSAMIIDNVTSFSTHLFRNKSLGIVTEYMTVLLSRLSKINLPQNSRTYFSCDCFAEHHGRHLSSAERDELLSLLHCLTATFYCGDFPLGASHLYVA